MTIFLRQSTASQEIPLGPYLDSTDGDTEETGLTIANTDIKIWKTGATTLANKNSGGATHISDGIYYCTLDATDTNTLGSMVIYVHVAGALFTKETCVVLAANVYDSLIAASDNLQVDATQIEGADATDQINAACDTALSDYDAPTKAELDSGLAGLNDLDAAGVRTAVGLASANLDTQLAALPTAAENADAVWDETLSGHLTAGSTGNALNAAGSAGDPWSTSLPGAYGAGTAGYIVGNNLNAPVGTVDTVVDAIKAVTDNLPNSGALTSLATASALATVDSNVDAILVDTGTTLPGTLSTIAGYIDTEVAAIKAKTDSLTFTVSGQVDANIQYVNDTAVTGDGSEGTEWGPA